MTMNSEELGNHIADKYGPGTFGKRRFRKTFGLEPVEEGEAFSEGSSTGTKQTGALGTYLTEEDFNRERNSDKTWDAYASVYGQEAMQSKREGNEEGLSINAFDSLMDKLSKDAPAEKATGDTPAQRQLSEPAARAFARSEAYDMQMDDPQNYVDLKKGGDAAQRVKDMFTENYKSNMKKRLKSGGGRGIGLGQGPMPRD